VQITLYRLGCRKSKSDAMHDAQFRLCVPIAANRGEALMIRWLRSIVADNVTLARQSEQSSARHLSEAAAIWQSES
jgi:hypothetical protein